MDINEVTKKETYLYSTQEVAAFMGVPYMTVYRLITNAMLKGINVNPNGKKPVWKFRAEDVQAYYDSLPDSPQRLKAKHE